MAALCTFATHKTKHKNVRECSHAYRLLCESKLKLTLFFVWIQNNTNVPIFVMSHVRASIFFKGGQRIVICCSAFMRCNLNGVYIIVSLQININICERRAHVPCQIGNYLVFVALFKARPCQAYRE